MTTEDIDMGYVCHDCIGDPFLAEAVRAEGTRVACSYCDVVGEALPLDDLAQCIHEVLQDHFELTPDQAVDLEYVLAREGLWERAGDLVQYVIVDITRVSEKIATDVMELLSDCYGYRAVKDGEENPYDSDACYEKRGPDDWAFRESWETFRDEIRFRTRFFSNYAEEALTHIFGDLGLHKSSRGKSVIRKISPDSESGYIWRGRTALSPKELEAILKSPAREIGTPPPRLAKGGRMNASGIPVFYGAMEKDTCIAELRAPVGSQVVGAKFELLRPVRLLDFEALVEIYVEVSHFDPDYVTRTGRAAFLRSLAYEICRPVMPQDKAFEYLPSQAVAEFLANKLDTRLDGIIFHSSQTGGGGRNVVLFNHACGVEPDDLPKGTEVEVYNSHSNYNEDDDSYIRVFETVPPPHLTPPHNDDTTLEDAYPLSPRWEEDDNENEKLPTYSEPTLRIDMESIFVLDIKSVQYDYHCREVFRHRRKG